MDRCLNCHYYDRNPSTGAGGKSANAGQCRRNAPMLSPVNPKTYMIEGVWPTIRDEDWCGEYRAGVRRSETSRADALLATLTPAVPRRQAGRGRTKHRLFRNRTSRFAFTRSAQP